MRLRDLVWAGLAALGLVQITPFKFTLGTLDMAGILWAGASTACWAVYIASGQKAGDQHSRYAAPLDVIVAAVATTGIGARDIALPPGDVAILVMILGLAILSGVIPFVLEMWALRNLPTRTSGTLMSLEPVVACVAGWILLGEHLGLRQMLAIALMVAACIGASSGAGRL